MRKGDIDHLLRFFDNAMTLFKFAAQTRRFRLRLRRNHISQR